MPEGDWLSGLGNWAGNLFSSSASNAAGFGNSDAAWAELGQGQYGPLSQAQITSAAKGAGTPGAGDPATAPGLFGLTNKQWTDAAGALGTGAKALAGSPQQTPAASGQHAAASGIHQGNPAAFNALLTQILQRRAALGPGPQGAPPGLMGASRG